MAAGGSAIDPIEQFGIVRYVPIHLFGRDFSFTNSAAYMLASVALISLVMILGSRHRALVPGRLQAHGRNGLRVRRRHGGIGDRQRGMQFFPLVFCIFMFILLANVIGLFPYSFSVTSQIIITVGAGAGRCSSP